MKITRKNAPYFFLSPAILFYTVFFVGPVCFALYTSFHDWNMLSPMEYSGMNNYRELLFYDDLFPGVLRNTIVFAIGQVALALIIALPLAVLIDGSRLKSFWRTIYFLPLVTSVVAIAYIWMFLYHPGYGFINEIAGAVGISGPSWLSSPRLALFSLIIVAVWSNLGIFIIIYLVGLENIPAIYYDAARIDGAGPLENFKQITLPLLRPTILFAMVYGMITALQAFALILIMTGGGPVNSTRVLALYMYETAFEYLEMGKASAMVFILFLIVFGITMVQLRILKRGGVESY
jgi:multiple sugar transport system permease protein